MFSSQSFYQTPSHTSFISTLHAHRRLTPYTHTLTTSDSLYQLKSGLNSTNFFSVNAKSSSPSSSSPETPTVASSTSRYLSVHIRCSRYFADMHSEALLCFGASSTSIDEQDSYDQNEEICISSIYAMSQDVHRSILHAADSIGMKDAPSYEVVMGFHSDWIKETQDLQATNIILNPGFAFGTGDHPTTKLCLLLLHGLIKGGESFLDYDTGSGILAIAAVKHFGAAFSVGFDIDPQAIMAARHNATLNNIGPAVLQLHLVPSANDHPLSNEMTTGGLEGQNSYGSEATCGTEKYDVVVANIPLYPLLDLADQIISYAKPGAVVAVSGIIAEQNSWKALRYQGWNGLRKRDKEKKFYHQLKEEFQLWQTNTQKGELSHTGDQIVD